MYISVGVPIHVRVLCMGANSLQSYPVLCNPMDHIPFGPSVHGILQAKILEWVAVPYSRASSQLVRCDGPTSGPTSLMSPALAGGFFTSSTTWEAGQCINS